MLKLILGGVNSDKNDMFTNAVIDEVKNKSDVLVIVPDQYSFEFDKELYGILGPRAFNQIEVIAFNKSAEIINKYCKAEILQIKTHALFVCILRFVSLRKKVRQHTTQKLFLRSDFVQI